VESQDWPGSIHQFSGCHWRPRRGQIGSRHHHSANRRRACEAGLHEGRRPLDGALHREYRARNGTVKSAIPAQVVRGAGPQLPPTGSGLASCLPLPMPELKDILPANSAALFSLYIKIICFSVFYIHGYVQKILPEDR
jgi:hypothetical protein